MSTDGLKTEDTGWKHPTIVKQYGGGLRGVINTGICYAFKNLDNIKKEDDTRAEQLPWAQTGVDIDHKSPYIYAYNYGFNLPSNAKVTKITLYARVHQLTHPKYYYEHYVLKRQVRYSVSKFCNVKLKQGTSTSDSGTGNQMASKCALKTLPYNEWKTEKDIQWSTEEQTSFSGTPEEWGLTGNVNGIINSSNFGVVIQYIGTEKNTWCNPGTAQLRLKVEYEIPKPVEETPSTFSKITVSYETIEGGSKKTKLVEFDGNNKSKAILKNLVKNNFDDPAKITFTYYHKGEAGETPYIVLQSNSLSMGPSKDAHTKKTDIKSKYTLPKLQCSKDTNEKAYTQDIYIFPGVNLNEQTITYTYNNVKYTLRFNVEEDSAEINRWDFVDQNNVCIIKNCLFYRNHAVRLGGANYITSEYYYGTGNIFGTGANANKADNVNNENGGKACPNTMWLKNDKPGCYDI